MGLDSYAALRRVVFVNPSSFRIRMPPRSSSGRFTFSAAGFIATRALGRPPGVRMSREAKWIWNADTPARVPAGARISAGKSGSVTRSLPIRAVAAAKRLPGELYAVARIAREADDNPLLFLENLGQIAQKRRAFRVRFYAQVWTGFPMRRPGLPRQSWLVLRRMPG